MRPDSDPVLQKAIDLFRETYNAEPEVAAFGPGRVNLIGEHTDYNEGFVFPLALELRTFVVGRGSLLVRPPDTAKAAITESKVISDSSDAKGPSHGHAIVTFVADKNLVPGEPRWANYIKGVVAEYIKDVPDGKYLVFEAAIASSVPLGSGLSSSASLEVAFATFLEQVIGTAPSGKVKALRCQSAEHKFAGVPCGIMDQFISALGKPGKVLLLDCRDQSEQQVPLSDDHLVILVTNSKVKHNLGGSEYPVRVQQCKAAVEALKKKYPEVKSLRGVTMAQLDSVKDDMKEVVYRRARHVVTEDVRTLGAVKALQGGRYTEVGRLMVQSHNSLRDDYEVSCKELDFLVEEAMKVKGVLGSRMTGGGFGGCTVTLVQRDAVEAVEKALRAAYLAKYGKEPDMFYTVPGAGSGVVDLRNRRKGDDVRHQRLLCIYAGFGVLAVVALFSTGSMIAARRGGLKHFKDLLHLVRR